MKIADIYKSKSLTTSFEVFPPNDKVGLEQVYNCLDILSLEKPDYISVTYGAGGNTKGRTVEIADRIKRQNGLEVLQCTLDGRVENGKIKVLYSY